MSKMFLILCLSLLAGTSRAGNEGARGGDGFIVGDKVYSLDLYQFGIAADPWYANIPADPEVQTYLEKYLLDAGVSPTVINLIARKISEIQTADPFGALAFAQAFGFFDWFFVPYELTDVQDEDLSIKLDPKFLVQSAVRKDRQILIDQRLWAKMDEKNQAALLMHEMAYALSPPTFTREAGKAVVISQKSALAKAMVAAIHSKNYLSNGAEKYWRNRVVTRVNPGYAEPRCKNNSKINFDLRFPSAPDSRAISCAPELKFELNLKCKQNGVLNKEISNSWNIQIDLLSTDPLGEYQKKLESVMKEVRSVNCLTIINRTIDTNSTVVAESIWQTLSDWVADPLYSRPGNPHMIQADFFMADTSYYKNFPSYFYTLFNSRHYNDEHHNGPSLETIQSDAIDYFKRKIPEALEFYNSNNNR